MSQYDQTKRKLRYEIQKLRMRNYMLLEELDILKKNLIVSENVIYGYQEWFKNRRFILGSYEVPKKLCTGDEESSFTD